MPKAGTTMLDRPWALIRAAFIVGGVVVLAVVIWQLLGVILLFFGAIVIATVLRSLARLIERILPLSSQWSLALACILILALVAGFSVVLGAQLSGQISNLLQQLPQQISALGDRLGISSLQDMLAEQAQSFAGRGNVVQNIAGYTSGVLGAAANLILVVVGGVYLAARPNFYFNGCLRIFPASIRGTVSRTAENAGQALRLWLLGQLLSMLLVGILITAGLSFIGIPSALALGVLAGLAEFVPIVGPILGAVPALLLALAQGGNAFLWTLGLYLLVQQVESNLIMPLVQRWTVDLPPVLTLFALLALGVLLGPVGVLLATPLTVVLYVAVKQLYIRNLLHEPVDVPGENSGA
ncbi:AI-2E family transporter [Rhodoligotrophos defluvii]|uniref:AI-2E family transporter n=1 Tax=Rhodoligotrophos defluvii TaxID=2561934 RepID=UPI001EEF8AA1|nr:AI-2E family transporter [Rhodoligotrophos defluvii]